MQAELLRLAFTGRLQIHIQVSLNIRQNVGDQDFSQYDIVFPGGVGENILYVIRIMPQ
jgi:hypothetical protein